ncbi:MAG TPA: carboxypeptidase regulatory-like domain-containing protein [Acidobacteriaceae bacterium]
MKRIALLLVILATMPVFAQEFRATLSGRVTDATDAVIPNVKIVVTNTETGVKVSAATDKSGGYTVPFLLPGTYSVSASSSGFQAYVHQGIQLLTGQKVEEDIKLSVGSETQEVRITADAPLIETASATSGQVLTAQEVEDLPDNGRSPLGLAKSMEGVVAKQKNSVVQARPFDNSAASDYSLGGGNSQSNEYLLNGVPNMQNSSRLPGYSPLQDSVQEVRVDLFESDASYGDTSGGTVNLVTKAGTNQFHGSVNEFNQFSAINAPVRWFVAPGSKALATRQNQYGGVFSGPVWIPKVFNGRNKLFFLYSFEGFKGSTPAPNTTTVPTAAERNGDFSALLAIGTTVTGTRCTVNKVPVTSTYNSYQLFDPASAVPDTVCTGQVLRTPIANNKITNINPIAQAYLKFYPLPNQTGAVDGTSNFFSNIPTTNNYTSQAGRLDYSINDGNKIFFETHRSQYIQTSSNIFQNISTGSTTYAVYQGGLFDYVHTFSPTATLDARVSLTRSYNNSSLPSQGFKASTLGLPGYLNQNAETSMTRLSFATGSFAGVSAKLGGIAAFDTIQYFTAFTKVLGHHTLKIGPDFRANKNSTFSPNYASGTLGFDKTFFGVGGSAAGPVFGGDLASFLEGIPVSGEYDISSPVTYNNWYWAAFIQDDWRISNHLTINLGLRGETETGINESQNRAVVGFNPTAVNEATAGAQTAYAKAPFAELPTSAFQPTGGPIFATASHRSEYATPFGYFSPRVGFAWAPEVFNNHMVARGGFGIYINPFNDYYTPQNYGYSSVSALVPTTNANLTPAASLADPFPTAVNPIIQPTGSSLGINQNLGSSITFRPTAVKAPYSERWDMDIQVQLSRNTMIDIGYIGNHQVHLSYSNCVSCIPQLPFLSTSPFKDSAQQTNLGTPNIPNPFKGLPGMTGSNNTSANLTKFALLAAYPQYSSVTEQLVPGQSATYNALIFRFYKRLSDGLTANVNYTYSHNLSTAQLNGGGPLTYQENASDFPNHLSITGSYQLPFGHNKPFFGHANHVVDSVIGGFTVNTVYQYLSGAALSWGIPLFANGTQYDPTLKIFPRQYTGAFDKTKFDMVANDQPSTTYNYRTFPQFYGRQDATNNLDASILKDFRAGERVKIQYRFESFNILNHASFGAPNLSPTAAAFGTITSTSSVPRVLQQGLRVIF